MTKMIIKILTVLITICALLSFSIAYKFHSNIARQNFNQSSTDKTALIAQKIKENNELIHVMEENLKQEYLVKARSVSLFLEDVEGAIYDQEKLHQYMELLTFEEIHFFDETGTIFAGTHPEYYGYSFTSGEQMAFFAPLLEDRNVGLAQDVAPNTAESKFMQYTAVWNEDRNMIIQIGHEPKHLIDALKTTELSYLLPIMIDDVEITFIAYDNVTNKIEASTNNQHIGELVSSVDLNPLTNEISNTKNDSFYHHIKDIGSITLIMSINEDILYKDVPLQSFVTMLIVVLITLIIIAVVMKLLHSVIIRPIFALIKAMKKIGKGNLDTNININHTPEFQSLSENINQMIRNLLEHDIHTTRLFQSITIPVAMFEYTNASDDVKVTGKMADVLQIDSEKMDEILKQKHLFITLLNSIQLQKLSVEDDIFIVDTELKPRYLKIKSYNENNKVCGFIIDMTSELQKQEQIRIERDTDHLTALNTRRAFLEKLQKLLDSGENFEILAMLMLDLDNLKYVNDTFGHESGDNLIATAANAMKKIRAPNKIISRLGGDEFVIVVHNCLNEEEVHMYIDEFKEIISQTYITVLDNQKIPISISGGFVFYGGAFIDCDSLLRAADETMYKVKKTKKGDIMQYSPDVD